MFPNERYDYILGKIKKQHSVTVSDLMNELQISMETVRRDLFSLETQGKLKRVHGGAISVAQTREFPLLKKRINENISEKRELSLKAMQYINEGDIIAIDSGSTSICFAHILKEHFKKLTVITHSFDVISILSDCPDYKLIAVGGMYLASEKAFYGAIAIETLKNVHVSKAFIFPSAISIRGGIQDFCYEVIDLQKLMIENADSIFILADNSKLEKTANIVIAPLTCKDIVISDNNVSDSLKKIYHENQIQLI